MAQIERLRRFRVAKPFDLSMSPDLVAEEKRLKKHTRVVAGLGDRWEEILPPELALSSTPERLSGGVLTIRTADSAAKFAMDRWLRGGGEAALKKAIATTISRIRLV
jgi:Dna[CI] antecedent, DciA